MDINFEKTIMNRRSRTLTQMAQSTRRLNSGYRINSAADDAAGLAVSEKMRSIDVGLRQGLRNISDGMNFLATQDNAEQVINDSLHRLKEIAVEAANGTNARIDREGLDLEYQQILDEIGDITSTGDFNGVPLFDQHQPEYSKFAGEIKHTEFIDVATGKNSPLVVNYTQNGVNKTVSLKIPSGRYSADEIADIIDDELYATNSPLIIGVNSDGQFSLQCEGGKVNYITGPGRSLFYEEKDGVKSGYLIGVTRFLSETVQVPVLKGENDEIKFRVQGDPSDRVFTVHLLKDGEIGDFNDDHAVGCNYNQLIDRFNEGLKEALAGTEYEGTIEAIRTTNEDGENVIGLRSDSPITGLSGDFIKLERPRDDYSSVLYDISTRSDVDNTSSEIIGKKPMDSTVNIYRDRNDFFYVDFKYYLDENTQGERRVRFDLLPPVEQGIHEMDYAPVELAEKINAIIEEEFKDLGFVPAIAEITPQKSTIHFETTQFGALCGVDLVEPSLDGMTLNGEKVSPSGYMLTDLFDVGNFKEIPSTVIDSGYEPAYCTGEKQLGGYVNISKGHTKLLYDIDLVTTKNDWILNDKLSSTAIKNSYTLEFDLDEGSYSTDVLRAKLQEQLDKKIADIKAELKAGDPDLKDSDLKIDMKFGISNGGLSLKANGEDGSAVTYIHVKPLEEGSTAYRSVIKDVWYVGGPDYVDGKSVDYKTPVSSSNIYYTPGTDANKEQYVSGNNSFEPSTNGVLYTFKYEAATMTRGDSPRYVDVITEENSTPATLVYHGAGTQFVDDKAIRDITVKFTVSDGVNTYDYDLKDKIKFGASKSDIENAIAEISKDMPESGRVKAKFNDKGELVITTEANGNNMSFRQYDSGNIIEKATRDPKANGAVIDIKNNTYTTKPKLILGDAGSHFPLTLTDSNRKISFDISGETLEVTLGEKGDLIYDSTLTSKINSAIYENEKLRGNVSARWTSNGLEIVGGEGFTGEIKYTSPGALPLDKRYIPPSTTAKPGMATLPDADTQFPITITDGTCNTLSFSYTTPDGTSHSVDIDLATALNGKYNNKKLNNVDALASALKDVIDNDPDPKYQDHKGNITFYRDYSTGGLVISTTGVGSNCGISGVGGNMKLDVKVKTEVPPAGIDPDIPNNKVHYPASVSSDSYYKLFEDGGMEVVKGRNDTISVTVDGETVTIKLDERTYTDSNQLRAQLENNTDSNGKKLTDIVNISYSGGLTFTSKKAGNNISISLRGTNANIFQTPVTDNPPDYQYRIAHNCKIIGTVDINNIEIHEWDNQMTFTYKSPSHNGMSEREVTIEIPPKTYANADELAEALQKAIDGAPDAGINGVLPPGHLKVMNRNGRIEIIGATITNDREIYDFSGRLYDRILQTDKFTYASIDDVHQDKPSADGNYFSSYILGRNPMEPVTDEEIEAGTNIIVYPSLNDNFVFDLKYSVSAKTPDGKDVTENRTAKIDLILPPGEYDRKKMAETITELTREQMKTVAPGLDPEYFRATIGLAPLGISDPDNVQMSSKDRLVLSYTVPKDGTVDDCKVTIDDVRGNICYRNFYQASDTPRPTTIAGAADISNGVTITPGVNDKFTVVFDGEPISIDLPGGYFTADELLNVMNLEYEALGAGIRASMKGDHLMLYSAENGAFDIDPIMGSASYTLFYGGEKRNDDDDYIGIHSGRRTDSYIWYQKTRLDQHLMRINTTGVTTIERAHKAMNRLDAANAYLLKWRGLNGANENRSARTYDRNNVIIENLENSESAIRDTDVPMELSKLQRQQVIQQFQDSMMKQTKQTVTDMVLNQLNQKG